MNYKMQKEKEKKNKKLKVIIIMWNNINRVFCECIVSKIVKILIKLNINGILNVKFPIISKINLRLEFDFAENIL